MGMYSFSWRKLCFLMLGKSTTVTVYLLISPCWVFLCEPQDEAKIVTRKKGNSYFSSSMTELVTLVNDLWWAIAVRLLFFLLEGGKELSQRRVTTYITTKGKPKKVCLGCYQLLCIHIPGGKYSVSLEYDLKLRGVTKLAEYNGKVGMYQPFSTKACHCCF